MALRGISRYYANCCVKFLTNLSNILKYLKQRVKWFYKN